MITAFHGTNNDGVGYWFAILVADTGRSRIVEVRSLARDRAEQLRSTFVGALYDCGADHVWVATRDRRIESLLSDIRAAHPAIFGRFG